MRWEPTISPFFTMSAPLAWVGKKNCARPVTASGYSKPNRTVVTRVIRMAMRRCCFIGTSSQMQVRDHHVDQLNAEERRHNAADPIDQEILTQQGGSSHRAITNPP